MLTIKDYQDGLREGKILGAICKECGNLMIPLKPTCSSCGSLDVEKFESAGKGKIRSFTVIYVAPKIYEGEVPYIVAVVELDEGGAVMGRLMGVDPNKPEDIIIGTKVKFEALVEDKEIIAALAFRIDR